MSTMHEPFDLLVRGGTVVDGTRAPRFDADVAVSDGKIVAIVAIGDLAGCDARTVLEAEGRIIAPGFICCCSRT